MAQTIGSAFAETFGTGQRIGDAWSERRFQAKAQAIRDEFQQRADAEGKSLQDYLPEMEDALRTAAASSSRRGLSLEQPVLDRWNSDVGRAGERAAGALAMGGDQAGARTARAGTQYALGNFDEGQGQQIAGDTIRATQGAMQVNPATGQNEYNPAAGASALSRVGAQYGNAGAAAEQQQQAGSFRIQAAQGLAGQLFNLFQTPEVANPDQVAGLFEGLKQYMPELQNTELRVGDDGSWVVYTGGKPSGSFNPKDRQDMDEFSSLLTQFSRNPYESLKSYTDTRIANIADQRKSDSAYSGKIDDAMIKVITEAKVNGIPDAVATKLANAGTGSGDSKGWQLQEMGDQPGSFLMQKGGNVYRIETNVEPNLEKGETGGKVQVFDLNGKPVNPDVLNEADRAGFQYNLSLISDLSKINNASQLEWMRGQLGALNSLREQRLGPTGGGTGASRGERNNNPGNIEDGDFAKGLPGYKGSDGRFAIFDTPENGSAAQAKLLQSYGNRGINTIEKIVGRWSPQSDPTNQAGSTANYVRYVAQRLGVQPGEQLDLSNPETAARVASAMAEFESGNTRSGALTTATPRPGNVVAGGTDAGPKPAVAQSAPAAQTPTKRRAITPESVRGQAGRLDDARERFAVARDRLQKFERDFLPNGTGPTRRGGEYFDPAQSLTPTQQRVYQQLLTEAGTAQQEMEQQTLGTRRGAAALTQQVKQSKEEAEASELYSRYGGAADFFRNAR